MMDIVRDHVLDQLVTKLPRLECYPEQERDLMQALYGLANDGKSGSILIRGSKGAGKTMLVNDCLKKLYDSRDAKPICSVKLSGILQTNDVAAVKELAKQLEAAVVGDDEDEAFIENAIRDLLLRKNREPVAIVVDEFDRFASDRSPEKQSFLYRLLDATHNATKPLLVIGISSHLNVLDSLEKRLRSRISQKIFHLSNDWSFEKYTEYAKRMLLLDRDAEIGARQYWNVTVEDLFSREDVRNCFKKHYETDRSMQRLRQYLTAVVAMSSPEEETPLSLALFQKVNDDLFVVDSWTIILQGLSTLEICILLATKHCLDIYGDIDDLNFELIYREYQQVARQNARTVKDAPKYPKLVVLQAFEKLCNMGIFALKTSRSQANLLQFQSVKLQIDANAIKTHVQKGQYPTYFNDWLHFG